jgi:hypothetical protein
MIPVTDKHIRTMNIIVKSNISLEMGSSLLRGLRRVAEITNRIRMKVRNITKNSKLARHPTRS